jgi:hypothetical protein
VRRGSRATRLLLTVPLLCLCAAGLSSLGPRAAQADGFAESLESWETPADPVQAGSEMSHGEPPWSDAEIGWSASPYPVEETLVPACDLCEPWTHQVVPDGLLYKSYLAGEKEPRIGSVWMNDSDNGTLWDSTLGGRVGLWRYGPRGPFANAGWQLDIEGAALLRLDFDGKQDLVGTDYRFGVPLTWRRGPLAAKVGYYHISSHVGDEFLIKNPTHERVNYVRESALVGLSYDVTPDVRVYGEIGYAVARSGGAEPWELQFGAEYSPLVCNGRRGSPFAAANVHLREEVDFGGNVVLQTGWQWRGADTNHLLRTGLQYYNGKSSQYSFFDTYEEALGVGIWFDY